MREDKAAITKKLEELINMTREGEVRLEYTKEYRVENSQGMITGIYDEAVVISRAYPDGETDVVGVANVSCDSGIALIRDVLKNNYFN